MKSFVFSFTSISAFYWEGEGDVKKDVKTILLKVSLINETAWFSKLVETGR